MSTERPIPAVLPLELRNVHIERQGRILLAIKQLTLDGQQCLAVIGPNGAGKSLLLHCLAHLRTPDQGQVLWGGQPPQLQQRRSVGLLLQHPVLLRRSAQANLVYALRAAGVSRALAHHKASECLAESGLAAIGNVPARLLSGGEQQRLALARALALKPAMLLLDEPTASVDPQSTWALEEQIRLARQASTGMVIVSHDLGQVRRLADAVLLMHQGRIVEQTPASGFFDSPTTESGRAFLSGQLLL